MSTDNDWCLYMNQTEMYYDFETHTRLDVSSMTREQLYKATDWMMFMSRQIAEAYNKSEVRMLIDCLPFHGPQGVWHSAVDEGNKKLAVKAVKGAHGDPAWRLKSSSSWMLQTPLYVALMERQMRTDS